MHSPVLSPPSFGDIQGLLHLLLTHPYLFVSSSTVITSGLVVLVLALGTVGVLAHVLPRAPDDAARLVGSPVRWLAPKLSLVLAYFGLGSLALATEIWLRFHAYIPEPVELQFRSGVGHLALAALGIAAPLPIARRCSRREWIEANFWALGYWTVHAVLLTPPWFLFQGQGVLVMRAVTGLLALGFAVTTLLWARSREGRY